MVKLSLTCDDLNAAVINCSNAEERALIAGAWLGDGQKENVRRS